MQVSLYAQKFLEFAMFFYCYCAFFGENFFVMPKEFTNLTPCNIFCRFENVKIWLKLVQFIYFVNLWILKSKLKVQFDHLILNFCLNRIWKLLSMNESGFRNDRCSFHNQETLETIVVPQSGNRLKRFLLFQRSLTRHTYRHWHAWFCRT